MKRYLFLSNILLCTSLLVVLSLSCETLDVVEENTGPYSYTYECELLYIPDDSLDNMVKILPPREIINPGGLYFKEDYIYILDKGDNSSYYFDYGADKDTVEQNILKVMDGIHIIDNRDPRQPEKIAFIRIPGINGMSAKDDYLYADSFEDLLVFDISDVTTPSLLHRLDSVYHHYNYYFYHDKENAQLQIGMKSIRTKVYEKDENSDSTEIYPQMYYGQCYGAYGIDHLAVKDVVFAEAVTTTSNSSNGVAGSLARFVTVGHYLYNIDYSNLHVFDISQGLPSKLNEISVGWEIETIYPYEDKLFFGAVDGMYIYDNTDPTDPTFLSKYEHIRSCDPVVVKGDIAYVTLRNGTECQSFSNQLDIINVANPTRPYLIRSYQMDNPHGLSVYDNCLYICEGAFGFKSFNLVQDTIIEEQKNKSLDIHTFDVITLNDLMMIIGENGLYQYANACHSDSLDLTFYSKIPFKGS